MEGILHALSDPTRVESFAKIADSNCSATCSTFLTVGEKAVPKSTLSQHFKVLREAGLVHSERVGVEMQNTSRCLEIETRFPGLSPAIVGALKTQSGERVVTRGTQKGEAQIGLIDWVTRPLQCGSGRNPHFAAPATAVPDPGRVSDGARFQTLCPILPAESV